MHCPFKMWSFNVFCKAAANLTSKDNILAGRSLWTAGLADVTLTEVLLSDICRYVDEVHLLLYCNRDTQWGELQYRSSRNTLVQYSDFCKSLTWSLRSSAWRRFWPDVLWGPFSFSAALFPQKPRPTLLWPCPHRSPLYGPPGGHTGVYSCFILHLFFCECFNQHFKCNQMKKAHPAALNNTVFLQKKRWLTSIFVRRPSHSFFSLSISAFSAAMATAAGACYRRKQELSLWWETQKNSENYPKFVILIMFL